MKWPTILHRSNGTSITTTQAETLAYGDEQIRTLHRACDIKDEQILVLKEQVRLGAESLSAERATNQSTMGIQTNESHLREVVLRSELEATTHRLEEVHAYHTDHIRIASMRFDPEALTARLRTIDSTLRVELDREKLTVYGAGLLPEPKVRKVRSVLQDMVDLT